MRLVGGVWYEARAQLRRRWRATFVLVAIVGIAGGIVLTTIAGARRSSTAYERFRQETLASDLDVAFEEPPGGDLEAAAAAVEELPQVAAFTRTVFPFIVPAGSGLYPYLEFLAVAPADDQFGNDIDRARVLAGRVPAADDADEIAITEAYAIESGLEVGDEVEFESFARDQMDPLFTTGDAGPPAGPRFTLEVTGIIGVPTFLSESTSSFQPRVLLSPAFAEQRSKGLAVYPGGFTLRLQNGADDVAEVSAELRAMFPDTRLELTPASEVDRKIQSSIDVIVSALLLCALAALAAGSVAVLQALTRHLSTQAEDGGALSAVGMTFRDRWLALAVTVVPVTIAGAALAVGLAIVASPLMPVGVARRAEPDLGVSFDATVLVLGGLGIALVTLGLGVVAAFTGARRTSAARTRSTRSRSAGARTGPILPPASIGIGMALEPRDGTGWAVRSALGGVAFGVAGVVAVLVFTASVGTLVDTPLRYGAPFDAAVVGFSGDVLAEGGEELLADPDVDALGVMRSGIVLVDGAEVNSHAVESLKGDVSLTMLDGRVPERPGEVVVGSTTLADIGAELGDEVEVDGARETMQATVVGTAVFPIIDERSSPGRGALLHGDDLRRISAGRELNDDVVLRWADGVDVEAANGALAERTGTEVFSPRLPADVNNLREVEALPRLLAVFLGALGALAALHALATTVRMRRRDLAVLRTLGLRRRQLTSVVSWEASVIGVLGLVVGVPLGLVAGRLVWRDVASGLGVVDDPVIPIAAIAIVVVAALVLVNLAALAPSRAARNVRPAAVLRAT